jgi:hypothetical protein
LHEQDAGDGEPEFLHGLEIDGQVKPRLAAIFRHDGPYFPELTVLSDDLLCIFVRTQCEVISQEA